MSKQSTNINRVASAFREMPDGTYEELRLEFCRDQNCRDSEEPRRPFYLQLVWLTSDGKYIDRDGSVWRRFNFRKTYKRDFPDTLGDDTRGGIGFNQFVLYGSNNKPVFVIDSIGKTSKVDWDYSNLTDNRELTIEAKIRNFFNGENDKDYIDLTIKIDRTSNGVRYKEFSLNGKPFVASNTPGSSPPFELRNFPWTELESNLAKPGLISTISTGDKFENNKTSDLFQRTIGLKLEKQKNTRQIQASFHALKFKDKNKSKAYSLLFESSKIPDQECRDCRSGQGGILNEIAPEPEFSITGNVRSLKIFDNKEFNNLTPKRLESASWKFIQYPAKNFELFEERERQRRVSANWIVQIVMPSNVFYDYWYNQIAGPYYKSLKLLKSGHKLSFLPAFRAIDNGSEWTAAYHLNDSVEYQFNNESYIPATYTFDTPIDNQIKVTGMTVQPTQHQRAVAVFEHLKTHANTPLEAEVSFALNLIDHCYASSNIESIYRRFEDENNINSVIIPIKDEIHLLLADISANKASHAQVRMGALDIGFSLNARLTPPTSTTEPCEQQKTGDFTGIRVNRYKENLFAVDIRRILLSVSQVNAGGQDDLPVQENVPQNSVLIGTGASDSNGKPFPDNDKTFLEKAKKSIAENNVNAPGCKLSYPLDDQLEAAIESRFRRSRPIVINPEASSRLDNRTRYLLRIEEQTRVEIQEQGSQTIRLSLQQKAGATDKNTASLQAIVIDNEPFLIAKVEFTSFDNEQAFSQLNADKEIGTWTNAAINGTGWQLASYSKPINLILPPQGIGEEMEKAKNVGYKNNDPDRRVENKEAVDFRLSPPAQIELDPSKSPKITIDPAGKKQIQKFNEPPWNLRRILGYPGQTPPGLHVNHLQFELLYGLSCDSEYPLLRLAEITSLLGGIPGLLPKKEGASCAYLTSRVDWAIVFNRYASRIAILEPWLEQQKGELLLDESTVCRIRKNDNLSNSTPDSLFRPTGPKAELANPTDQNGNENKLEGGVTWGFESANVYNAVMKEGKSGNPESPDKGTAVSGLHFSGFGGWGRVKAPFDEQRTTIYSDVSMGRTATYKLERIGRIGCFWNIAKHVIVYERTVIPSRQMNSLQNELKGLPVVRKVREYVKILESRRIYPDGEFTGNTQMAEHRGCINACLFDEGAEFNVLSSWGTDVGETGWKVPLWNPNVPKDRNGSQLGGSEKGIPGSDVYPKPDVKLEVFSNVDGKSVPYPCTIDNPENLYFYTDTRVGTGSDPNKWSPVKGVDFADMPIPKPAQDIAFKEGINAQTTPNDPLIPPGLGVCTFTLQPSPVPADLVKTKTQEPLSAVLKSVTMVRSKIIQEAKETGDESYQKLLNLRQKAIAAVEEPLLEAVKIQKKTAENVNQIKDKIKDVYENQSSRLENICSDIRIIGDNLKAAKEQLNSRVISYETASFSRLVNGWKSFLVKSQFEESCDEIINTITNVEEVKRRGLQIFLLLQEGLVLIPESPGILERAIQKQADALLGEFESYTAEFLQKAKAVGEDVNRFLAGKPPLIEKANLKELQDKLRSIIEDIEKIRRRVRSVNPKIMEWLPNPTRIFEAILSFARQAEATLANIQRFFNEKETLAKAEITAAVNFLIGLAPQIEQRKNAVRQIIKDKINLLNRFEALKLNEKYKIDFPQPVYAVVETLKKSNDLAELKLAVKKIKKIATNKGDDSLKNIRSVEEELNALSDAVTTATTTLLKEWDFPDPSKPINDACEELKRGLKNIHDEFQAIVGQYGGDLEKGIREITDKIKNQRDVFLKEADKFVETKISSLLPVKDFDKEFAYAVGDAVPKLIRAFGEPPKVPNLTFDRPEVAYFYGQLSKRVDITPVLARAAQISEIGDALKPLGVALPTEALLDKLIPPDLKNFKLSEVLPNFGGLDLENLFSSLKLPEISNDKLKITHGLDKQSRRAWTEADININITEDATLFSIGPFVLRIKAAVFTAKVKFEVGLDGTTKKVVFGSIKGDWEVVLGDMPIVIFESTELRFDESGKFKFNISPSNVKLPGILAFVSDYLSSFGGDESGFSLKITTSGVKAMLNLPIPDTQAGTSGISNLILGMSFELDFSGPFKICLGFNLGSKEAPFTTTIFILGGSGYLSVKACYTPSLREIDCQVDVILAASASALIALGPIKGGVQIFLGVTGSLYLGSGNASQNSGLELGVIYIIRGQVSILGIVTAGVGLVLQATYRKGVLTGRGHFYIKIKICWCYTLKVSRSIVYTLGKGGSTQNSQTTHQLKPDERAQRRDERNQIKGKVEYLPPNSNEPQAYYQNAAYFSTETKRNQLNRNTKQSAESAEVQQLPQEITTLSYVDLADAYIEMLS
jgi:hypothetical protein